ncbi:hypothetical protein [Marinobacter apostichopi]|uniref:hypothetical protein n=1 Tax=Marinobacter apostichopi TaxID=3035454 RepID=UPI00336534C6
MQAVSGCVHALNYFQNLLASVIVLLGRRCLSLIPSASLPANEKHHGSDQRDHEQAKPHHCEPGHSEYHSQSLIGGIPEMGYFAILIQLLSIASMQYSGLSGFRCVASAKYASLLTVLPE